MCAHHLVHPPDIKHVPILSATQDPVWHSGESALPGLHSDWVTRTIVISARPSKRRLEENDTADAMIKVGTERLIDPPLLFPRTPRTFA